MMKTENIRQSLRVANTGFVSIIAPLLAGGHTVRFHVRGTSMRPVLEDGRDQVVLASAENIAEGDLVLARVSRDRYVFHRVIRREGERLTLMGDGCLEATEWCSCTDVVGKAVLLIRKGRCVRLTGLPFRLYTSVWIWMKPVRRYLLAVYKLGGGSVDGEK